MRILHCTDIHFNRCAMQWIVQHGTEFDLVCLTGDFLDNRVACNTPLHEQVNLIRDWFHAIQSPLCVCSGNHDYYEGSLNWLKSEKRLWFADSEVFSINSQNIGSLGYRNYNFEQVAECTVLLTHVPPARTSVAKENGSDYGCNQLRAALKSSVLRPNYILCGHVHSPHKNAIRLNQTVVSNPGGNHGKYQPSYCAINVA